MGLANIQLYKIDKEGRPIEAIMATQEQAMQSDSDWVLGHIDESIPFPKWDKDNREWVNGETDNEFLKNLKDIKLKELSQTCKKSIISGFTQIVEGNEYNFHYDTEDQQNFSDTIRLFENNMIDKIGWNAYLEEEKVRIQLDKEMFTAVYLVGVKHKTNCLTRLNDILYPIVDEALSIEQLESITWDSEVVLPEESSVVFDDSNTIEKQINKTNQQVQQTSQKLSMTSSGLLELTLLTMMGGY